MLFFNFDIAFTTIKIPNEIIAIHATNPRIIMSVCILVSKVPNVVIRVLASKTIEIMPLPYLYFLMLVKYHFSL